MEINVENCLKQNDNFACQSGAESIMLKDSGLESIPQFSIVIPTYKRLETLVETVSSALAQRNFNSYDVVIVEDNPENGTPIEMWVKSLEDKRIRYYKNSKNLGLVGNFNRAVSLADGEYAVLLHDDDFLFPDYLARMAEVIRHKPDADIICARPVKWHEDRGEAKPKEPVDVAFGSASDGSAVSGSYNESRSGAIDNIEANSTASKHKPVTNKRFRLWKPASDWEPFCRNFLPTGVTFRRDTFMKTGGFDHLSGPSTDLYYIVRVGQSVNYYMYECPLFVYRWSKNESMKFSTRVDFIEAGLPLRRSILEKHKIPKQIAGLLLKNYCAVSQANMKRDFPDKSFNIDGFILPCGKFEAFIAKKTQDILSWCLRLRKIGSERY